MAFAAFLTRMNACYQIAGIAVMTNDDLIANTCNLKDGLKQVRV
jgi:hypothetical protein